MSKRTVVDFVPCFLKPIAASLKQTHRKARTIADLPASVSPMIVVMPESNSIESLRWVWKFLRANASNISILFRLFRLLALQSFVDFFAMDRNVCRCVYA